MQISLKLIYYTHKKYADGSHPIILQYIHDRKIKKKVLTSCLPENWDTSRNRVKDSAPNASYTNSFLELELLNAEKDLYDLKNGKIALTDLFKTKSKVTFDQALNQELLRLKREFKSGLYDKVLALKRQINDPVITISEMDRNWFESMIIHMRKLGNIGSTIQKKIKLIRGIISRYSEFELSKDVRKINVPTQKSLKIKLSREELDRIELLILPIGDRITAARDLFLLQIYLRGIRIGDLLQSQSTHFEDGRFTYRDEKTKNLHSMKIIDKAGLIVEKYRGKYCRLFPFFSWKACDTLSAFENDRKRLKHKESCTTIVNKHLKVIAGMAGINKPLSSHIARHTFARMAIDKVNNPMITMNLLGHTSLAVHQQYLKDIRNEEVLDDVTDEIFTN